MLILLIIFTLFLFFNKRLKEYRISLSSNIIFLILLAYIVLGFITITDNNRDFGCFVFSHRIVEFSNIVLSGISFILIGLSFLIKHKTIRVPLNLLELLFWISKMLFYKGGYAVGIAGSPDPFIVLYDYFGLAIRIFLILKILDKSLTKGWISIIALIMLSIRILIPLPIISTPFEVVINNLEMKRNSRLIQGSWNGTLEFQYIHPEVTYSEQHIPILDSLTKYTTLIDTLISSRIDTAKIDAFVQFGSAKVNILTDSFKINACNYMLEYTTRGQLYKEDTLMLFHLRIRSLNRNSLTFSLIPTEHSKEKRRESVFSLRKYSK